MDSFADQVFDRTAKYIEQVFNRLGESVSKASDLNRLEEVRKHLRPGKMLRTQLGIALCEHAEANIDSLARASAATEMIHTATLFHDDVIEGGMIRRNQDTLWREVGTTGAILLGDLFFSTAIDLLLEADDLFLAKSFVGKVRELCLAEVEHELLFRSNKAEIQDALHLARGKTGTLFAFIAESCADRTNAQEIKNYAEVGYLVGTAYQLLDDILDEVGTEESMGKTLHTDKEREKFTLVQQGWSREAVEEQMQNLEDQACALIAKSPDKVTRLRAYIGQFSVSKLT